MSQSNSKILLSSINNCVLSFGGAILYSVDGVILIGKPTFQKTIPSEVEQYIQHCLTYGTAPTSELQKEIPAHIEAQIAHAHRTDPYQQYWMEQH